MPQFRHLHNPDTYFPGLWDLRREHDARAEWLMRLRRNVADMVTFLADGPDAHLVPNAEKARVEWESLLRSIEQSPDVRERYASILDLVRERDRLLRASGVEDLYRSVKVRETTRSLDLVAAGYSLASNDVADVCGRVLAGNVFDMASPRVSAAIASGDLRAMGDEVATRVPAIDDRAALTDYLDRARGHATICVDNAGADFVIGTLSLARTLLDRGLRVSLAANEHASLNDVLVPEANKTIGEIARHDATIAAAWTDGRLAVVSTGNAAPGIDFRDVTQDFNRSTEESEFLVLIGQGRAIEGGWRAEFSVPTLRLATIKSPMVAAKLGMEAFDTIVRFCEAREPA